MPSECERFWDSDAYAVVGHQGSKKPFPKITYQALKEQGNAAFKGGRYDEAARRYTAALALRPRCAVYLANRALAHLKLGAYSLAEADCDAALTEDVANAKALLRRGSARMAQVGEWAGGAGGQGGCGGGRGACRLRGIGGPLCSLRASDGSPAQPARDPQGNVEGARTDFQRVLAVEPQNRQAREELRAIEAMEGRVEEAGLHV